MKSRIWSTALLLGAFLVTGMDVMAGKGGGLGRLLNAPDPNEAATLKSPFKGTVVSLNNNSLTVKGEDSKKVAKTVIRSFRLLPDTKLQRDGKPCETKDIHPNDSVVITFVVKEGSTNVHTTDVSVETAPAAANKATGDEPITKKP